MSPYLFVLSLEYMGIELNLLALNEDFNFHPDVLCWAVSTCALQMTY